MKTRILLGGLVIAALGGVFWLDRATGEGAVFTGLVVLGVLLGFRELFALLPRASGPGRALAILGGAAVVAAPGWLPERGALVVGIGLLPVVPALLMVAALARREAREGIDEMRTTVFAFVYLGVLPATLVWVRCGHPDGWSLVLGLLIATKCADTGAYFTGRLLGRRKLVPRLSPNKTVEGLVGGLVLAGLMGGLLFGAWLPVRSLGWIAGAGVGLIAGAFGTLGDLVESQLKRAAEVKDSGRLLPAFGGVLDMIDSPLLAAPAALLVFQLLRG